MLSFEFQKSHILSINEERTSSVSNSLLVQYKSRRCCSLIQFHFVQCKMHLEYELLKNGLLNLFDYSEKNGGKEYCHLASFPVPIKTVSLIYPISFCYKNTLIV